MNKSIWITGLLIISSGCSTMNNAQADGVTGGIVGAFTGAVIGAAAAPCHPVAALIGAGAGAVAGATAGAAIGHAEDKAEQRAVQNYEKAKADAIYAAQHPPVSLEEIATLTRQRMSDDVIITHIQRSGSTYILYSEQLTYLKQQGVSDRVILFMQSRPPMVARPAPVFVPGPPPPPIGVGIGFGGVIR